MAFPNDPVMPSWRCVVVKSLKSRRGHAGMVAAAIADMLARARVSLLGLAVGDAFGERLLDEVNPTKRVAKRLISIRRPWRWTDDTAMAIAIVEQLARAGTIDPDALATAFATSFLRDPGRGYGLGAATVLGRITRGAAWRDEAQRLFGGRGSWGNGAAMRAAPIGAYFAPYLERVRVEALLSAAPTHAHPDGGAGAAAVAIAAALAAMGTPRERLIAETARHTPEGKLRDRLLRADRLGLDCDVELAGEELGTGLDISALDTVPFCVWVAARHLDSFEEAIWAATSWLGDRDTLGAITGGIVACATGVDGIPLLWREATEPLPAR
ncbi:MAG: ADP-ribosylglycohydrolase family protein [Kofleriaceae bacterium]